MGLRLRGCRGFFDLSGSLGMEHLGFAVLLHIDESS